MSQIQYNNFTVCSRCVMDTTDPDITFNEKGWCNHCTEFIEKEKQRQLDKTKLPWLLHRIRKSGKKYDCLIGLSGGVDSSLTLHYLVENGLKPYAYSVDNGWNTPESDENIMRLVETLKVPFYRYVLDSDKFLELQASFLEASVANVEIPTDHMLMASSYETAVKNDIKYIVSGGNLATEGIMPKAWGYQARDLKHIKAVYKYFTRRELTGLPVISLLNYLYYRFIKRIEVVNLLDYYEYNREEAKKLLNEKYGWKDYGEKHCESAFTVWFQNYYLPTKFNYDKRKPHYSSMINSGQMTREDAMRKLTAVLEYPAIMTRKHYMKYPKKTYKHYPNSEFYWNLLSKIYGYIHK